MVQVQVQMTWLDEEVSVREKSLTTGFFGTTDD
jgi:hypothetical protein